MITIKSIDASHPAPKYPYIGQHCDDWQWLVLFTSENRGIIVRPPSDGYGRTESEYPLGRWGRWNEAIFERKAVTLEFT